MQLNGNSCWNSQLAQIYQQIMIINLCRCGKFVNFPLLITNSHFLKWTVKCFKESKKRISNKNKETSKTIKETKKTLIVQMPFIGSNSYCFYYLHCYVYELELANSRNCVRDMLFTALNSTIRHLMYHTIIRSLASKM